MREKNIILAARFLSMAFTPFYLSFVGVVALFVFSYLTLLPIVYKLWVLALVYLFTILMPTLVIHLYRRYHGWTPRELGKKERRVVPYIISILCYFICCHLMERWHVPHCVTNVLMAALMIQVVCALINVWWKISTHTAAIGGVGGALVAFADLFLFNPMWWLSIVIIVGGMVGTARMLLRQHNLTQVVAGFVVGMMSAYFAVLFT